MLFNELKVGGVYKFDGIFYIWKDMDALSRWSRSPDDIINGITEFMILEFAKYDGGDYLHMNIIVSEREMVGWVMLNVKKGGTESLTKVVL